MVLETQRRTIGLDIAREYNTTHEQQLDEQKLLDLCWELYSAQGSVVRRSSLDNRYYFDHWLKSKNQTSNRSNLAILLAELPNNLSQKQLITKVNRWLNQNLPG